MNRAHLHDHAPTWLQAWKQGWEDFWLAPADPRPLAAIRVIVGLTVLLYLWSFSGDLARWLGPAGLLSQPAAELITGGIDDRPQYRFSVLSLAGSPAELTAIHVGCLLIAAAFTIGLATRVSAALTLAVVLSYAHRTAGVGSLLDAVLPMFLLYLVIAPAGAFLSIDRLLQVPAWLRGGSGPGLAARIALRLMQVHFAALVFVMGAAKLYGDAWWDGEAMWFLMAQTHSRPLDLTFLREHPLLLNAWTHLVVYTQLALAPLVWSRLTRPVIVILAALAWVSLIPVTGQTLFCLFMAAAHGIYLPDWLSRLAGPAPVSQVLPAR